MRHPADDDRARADDDTHWLDLLAGRRVAEASPGTRREADALRQALRRHRRAAPAGSPRAPEQRIAALLARARAAGVLPAPAAVVAPPAAARAPARPVRRIAWPYALAASVGVLALVLLRAIDPPPAPDDGMSPPPGTAAPPAVHGPGPQIERMRGDASQQRWADDPTAERDRVLMALRGAGFDAQPFAQLGRPSIDLALPVPLPAVQAQVLARLGIQAPGGPALRIEWLRRPGAVPASAASAGLAP